ncbi:PREDICTED: uncharacterized protein LOC109242809 [Nicotiana attenuata]|uniref:uncharacterized protein LOC109242809 n=1 Tax=Nicotiana attenuata TaxID=49451 RepID=UPI000904BE00|nr:PREDICTED: uncharacterized protein LOC109242809 [Nicotiana attenuata]
MTGFTTGELPFRYLGVPLRSKRLSVSQCQPLLDKMLGKNKQWTVKFLSYVGRLQLIKSVLIAIQSFWSQIFPLPKKTIQLVEAICRKFLWTGDTSSSKKVLVVWDKLCRPKTKGGLNVTDLGTWNRVALLKHLWNLCKKDKLWIRWVHVYYVKGKDPWEVDANQASWIIRKILQAGKYMNEAGLNTGMGKLYTKYTLNSWGIQVSPNCPLCEQELECHKHLFFACPFSVDVWRRLLAWLGITRRPGSWDEELKWAMDHVKGKGSKTMIYRMSITGAVYHLWLERNRRVFQQEKICSEDIVRHYIKSVSDVYLEFAKETRRKESAVAQQGNNNGVSPGITKITSRIQIWTAELSNDPQQSIRQPMQGYIKSVSDVYLEFAKETRRKESAVAQQGNNNGVSPGITKITSRIQIWTAELSNDPQQSIRQPMQG